MKKFLIFIGILFLISSKSFANEETTFLTGKIQSAEFLKNANQFVLAIITGNNSEVKRLLELGANPNEKYSKVPVIYFASHLKYDGIMNLLLEYGADPNTTFLKESILKYSIYRDCTKCVSYLVDYGADVNLKTFACSTPLDFALKLKKQESANILMNAGAKSTRKTQKLLKKLEN